MTDEKTDNQNLTIFTRKDGYTVKELLNEDDSSRMRCLITDLKREDVCEGVGEQEFEWTVVQDNATGSRHFFAKDPAQAGFTDPEWTLELLRVKTPSQVRAEKSSA